MAAIFTGRGAATNIAAISAHFMIAHCGNGQLSLRSIEILTG